MVCRHCPRPPPWRPAPLAFLFPPLLLSLALATAHRSALSTPTPPTLPHHHHHHHSSSSSSAALPPTPITHAHHRGHHHQRSARNTFSMVAGQAGNESQCALEPILDLEKVPLERIHQDYQMCPPGKQTCALQDALCVEDVEERAQRMRRIRLRYCQHLVLESVMSPRKINETFQSCGKVARHLEEEDALAGRVIHQFLVVHRYNCDEHYSIIQNCTACEEAYKFWVCSQLFPYYINGTRVKPCRSFCQEVEQKCPYLLPKDKPVAGEPTFLCQDPSIGELESQESSYGPDSCCYSKYSECNVNETPSEHPVLCSTCNGSSSPTGSSPSESHRQRPCHPSLSANGADSRLSQSHSPSAAPSSSGGCSVISRKHCWTPTALSILLLCLVRTPVWLPRGFT